MKGPYLRILTPQTTNGVNPIMGADGKIKYRESHMHISAQKRMEKKNGHLPQHLKHIIEVVNDDQAPPQLPIKPPAPAAQARNPARVVTPPPAQAQSEEATNGHEQHEAVEQPKIVRKPAAKRNRKRTPAKA